MSEKEDIFNVLKKNLDALKDRRYDPITLARRILEVYREWCEKFKPQISEWHEKADVLDKIIKLRFLNEKDLKNLDSILEMVDKAERWDIISEKGKYSLAELQIRIRNLEVDNTNRRLFLEVAETRFRKIEGHFIGRPLPITGFIKEGGEIVKCLPWYNSQEIHKWFTELEAILKEEE